MILGFLFFIQTFLKHCKALSTEKYKCYINILLLLFTIIIIKVYSLQNPQGMQTPPPHEGATLRKDLHKWLDKYLS